MQAANGKPAQQKQADTKKPAPAPGARSGAPPGQPKQEQKPLAVLAPADLDDALFAGAAKPPAKPLAKPKVSVKDSLYNPKKVRISLLGSCISRQVSLTSPREQCQLLSLATMAL